jgi:hypothetical protein
MTTRSSFLLCALVAAGFAIVIVMRWFDTARPIAVTTISPVMQMQSMRDSNVAPVWERAAAAPSKPGETTRPVATESASVVGEANGSIRFERKPQERDTQGESINLDVKSAVGVWQPDGLVMRVLLLETPPAADNVGAMLGAIQSGETNRVVKRSAVLELRFLPTAQAFDRNELDSATLIVSDGNSMRSADALGGLDWPGSLPSPSAPSPSGQRPSFTLEAANETVSSARDTWKQSWRRSVSVPVVTR